jgi:hypothetical protein
VNILNLWAVAQGKGYDIPLWATYAQWHDAGAGEEGREIRPCRLLEIF